MRVPPVFHCSTGLFRPLAEARERKRGYSECTDVRSGPTETGRFPHAALARLVLLVRAMSWRALIDGDEAIAVAMEIVTSLQGRTPGEVGLGGSAGQALLLSYAATAVPDASDELVERGSTALDDSVARLGAMRGLSLWSGVSGVRFAVSHLTDDETTAEVAAVIDRATADVLAAPWHDTYDLIGGLVGIGVAALEGGGDGAAVVGQVVAQLERLAESRPEGVAWHTPPALVPDWQRVQCPDGYYNLGLAHGVPGVIGFLAAVIEAGLDDGRAAPLARAAVAWLEAAVPPAACPRFPGWVAAGSAHAPARPAWCYGDGGVVLALWRAGRALEDHAVQARALALAQEWAAMPFETSRVVDPALCHGVSGVAHMMNRLHQATGDAALGDAAVRWYEQLLAMRRPGHGIGGYQVARANDDGLDWVDDPDLLSGVGGVALALLAAGTTVEPRWDRVLLCDLPIAEAA